MKKKLICFFKGHDPVYVGRDNDWLSGGIYTYQCSRCERITESTPYLGGN